jgi:hypothetical protein
MDYYPQELESVFESKLTQVNNVLANESKLIQMIYDEKLKKLAKEIGLIY